MTRERIEQGPYAFVVPPDLRARHCEPTVPLSQIESEFAQLCDALERGEIERQLDKAARKPRRRKKQ